MLGSREVLGHHGGQVEIRLARPRPHHGQVQLGSGGEMLVERDGDHTAAPGLEVRHDVLDPDHLPHLADPGDDGDAPLHQL
ncbi:hypothetical protein [Streptomyces sp. NPDC006925]|uniref:hypothetical protein n=1 Tax=Streptomyces sp. NPDC006925 TaxID=3364768 RepID=UPI00368CD213